MTTTSELSGRRTVLTRAVLAVTCVLAFVMFSSSIPYFLSVDNLINLLNELALAGIVAMPATFLIMSGQVDLSVGATAAFVGIVLAATAPGAGLLTAVLLAVGTGLLIGVVNGLLVTVGVVDSIAATFATMALLRGLAYLVPSGLAITLSGFRSLGNTRPVLGIALPTLIFGAAALVAVLLSRSTVGRRSRDTGLIPAAERLDGQRERALGDCVVRRLRALCRIRRADQDLPTRYWSAHGRHRHRAHRGDRCAARRRTLGRRSWLGRRHPTGPIDDFHHR